MKTRIIDGVEVHRSSGNLFADLKLPNAEQLKVKARLAIEIQRAIERLCLSQQKAALRMGISQSQLSALLRGEFDDISEHQLMSYLNRLGYDIEIKVQPANQETGQFTFAIN